MFSKIRVFLLVHVFILGTLFALSFLGLATDIILMAAAAIIAMEAIYMAAFTKEAAGGACRSVKEMEAEIIQLKEAASETVKLHRALIYAGHQIKKIQQELDLLKRKEFKPGNGHTRRVHHPLISHS